MSKNILFLLALFNLLQSQQTPQAPIGLPWSAKDQAVSRIAYLQYAQDNLKGKKLKDKLTLQNDKQKLKEIQDELKQAQKVLKQEEKHEENIEKSMKKITRKNKKTIIETQQKDTFVRF